MSVSLSVPIRLAVSVFTDPPPQRVTVTAHSDDPLDDGRVAAWRARYESLAAVVNHGGLCGRHLRPGDSSMSLLTVDRVGEGDVQVTFEIAGVDPGAWRVVAGIVATDCSTLRDPRASIVASAVGRRPVLGEGDVWDVPYPEAPDRPPFVVDHPEPDPTSYDCLVRIRFAHPLDPPDVAEVTAAVLSWRDIAFGGFPEEGGDPLETGASGDEAYLVDSRTVEYPTMYRGAEAAFDVLVAMAVWFHERRAPVEVVEIQ